MTAKPDFEALFNASPYPYVLIAPDLTILGANKAYCRATGVKAEDIIGKNAFDAFPPNPNTPDSTNVAEVRASVHRVITTGQPHNTPLVRYALKRDTPEGPVFEERYWTVLHIPVLDASGEVAFIAQNTIDVTDYYASDQERLKASATFKDFNRAQMQEAMTRILSDESSQLRSLLNQAPEFVAVLRGRNFVFEMVNEAYYRLVGQRDIIGKPLAQALPELADEELQGLRTQVFNTGKPYAGRRKKVSIQREPGGPVSDVYIDFVFQPLLDARGKVTGIFVQGQDVTEAHEAQLARQIADERLQEGLEIARMAVWDWDLASGKMTYSKNAPAVFGCIWENIDGVWEDVHPDDLPQVKQAIQKALDEKSSYNVVNRLIRRDTGNVIWLNSRGKVLCDAAGKPAAFHGISLDITERERAKAELAERVQQLADAERRQAFQLKVSDRLRHLTDSPAIFKEVSQLLGQHLQASRVLCGDYDLENGLVTYHSNYTGEANRELNGTYPADYFGKKNFESLASGAIWVCDDLQHDPRTAAPDIWPAFQAFGIHAAVMAPLNRRGALVACLFVNDAKPRHWTAQEITLIEDIAERMWIAVERARAEEALRQADIRKDEFLAMLAHELRNPLAPISTAAELLKVGTLDAGSVQRTSQVIARQVKHMTDLVNDLLDVSRVTRGLVVLEKRKVDIKQVVSDAVEQGRPLIEARRHHLSVHMPPDTACVLGDHKRLVQVLANLLANSVKYTPEGGSVHIDMTVTQEQVVVCVSDNGIGIPKEILPHIFELFAQAQRTPDRSQGGLGLGLALVKNLVELHGGNVTAHSAGLNTGSKFVLRLPRLPNNVENEVPARGDNSRLASGSQPLRILVVDDNVDAADTLDFLLKQEGYVVDVEYTAEGALARAEREAFDVFMLDIGLPGIEGKELARRLRTIPLNERAVLIAVTGYGQDYDKSCAMASGFEHYFVKPVDVTRLLAVLASIRPNIGTVGSD